MTHASIAMIPCTACLIPMGVCIIHSIGRAQSCGDRSPGHTSGYNGGNVAMSRSPILEKSPTDPPHISGTQKSPEQEPPDPSPEHAPHAHGVEWADLARIAFVAIAAAAVWFRLWEPFPRVSVIGITAALIGGYPIFKEAFENMVERKMTM